MKRWLEIAKASVKQSGRDTTVLIEEPVDLRELMSRWCKVDCLKLFLWEGEEKNDIKGVLKGTGSKSVVVAVVGPEGGFSKKEVEYARDAGFITASFGERTLRADTAAISLVAIVQYEFGCLAPGFASAC
jgi:16S rRNA (uracil1498-N3)-methyltransferase